MRECGGGAAIILPVCRTAPRASRDFLLPTPHANRVRIIGGAFRGRVVRFPASVGLRPTPDRVRETLFNWLGQDLTGKRCLDLYAGSGALARSGFAGGVACGCDRHEPRAD